jgi:SnoaL-like domain
MTMPSRQSTALIMVLAALGVLPPLYAWAVRIMLRRNLGRLWAGDPGPLLATYADDVHFVFPGRSSWAADLRGRDEVERWLRRFVQVGLQFEVHELLVAGPPWNTTVCLWFTDRLRPRMARSSTLTAARFWRRSPGAKSPTMR